MVKVSWNEALDYAEWVGKRLPTEAEWDMLHVGDGITHDDANFLSLQKDRKDKWMYSAPVGSFDP